jgi:hypothetical protein
MCNYTLNLCTTNWPFSRGLYFFVSFFGIQSKVPFRFLTHAQLKYNTAKIKDDDSYMRVRF